MVRVSRAASIVLLLAACGPTAPPPAAPSHHDDGAEPPADFVADCDAFVASWRADLGVAADEALDPELAGQLASQRAGFACGLDADLDGDGRDEQVVVGRAAATGAPGFEVRWPDGRRDHLGAGVVRAIPAADPADGGALDDPSFGWVVHWQIARHVGPGVEISIARRPHPVLAPDALGAALQLSGSDAAIIVYLTTAGWRWRHLGF